VRDLEPGARGHRSLLRGEFSEEQPDQRGLAAAVGSEDADAIAAQDRSRVTSNDRHAVVCVTEILAAQHDSARPFGFL